MILNYLKPKTAIDLTYSGIPMLDIDTLMSHCEDDYRADKLNVETLVNDLVNGKIIGVSRQTSEHGPRALGNRSIICEATNSETYSVLNKKLQRNDFMPFAPAVLDEDSENLFDINKLFFLFLSYIYI